MRGRGLIVGVLCAGVLAPAAHAAGPLDDFATIGQIDPSQPTFRSWYVYDARRIEAGHAVSAVLSADNRTIRVEDPGVTIVSLSPDCETGPGWAVCRGTYARNLVVQFGPGADTFSSAASQGQYMRTTVYAGAGDDVLENGWLDAHATFHGEAGDDRLLDRAGGSILYGGDGADDVRSLAGANLSGGAGDDRLVGGDLRSNDIGGGAGDDVILGGAMRDDVRGGDGDDVVQTGDGGDFIFGGLGSDEIDGGAGHDWAMYGDRTDVDVRVTLDGVRDDGAAGENDLLDGIESVSGPAGDGPGGDVLVGDAGANDLYSGNGPVLLQGLDGDDSLGAYATDGTLDGGPGDDTIAVDERDWYTDPQRFGTADVHAGDGDDTVLAAIQERVDGEPDTIACGDGWDVVEADHEDVVALDCEVVTRD